MQASLRRTKARSHQCMTLASCCWESGRLFSTSRRKRRLVQHCCARMHAYPGTIMDATALETAMPASDEVVLYTHMMCPYAQRAWLVVLEKQAPHTLVHVDLSSKPDWFLNMNARGQVPFAALHGKQQGESIDICRWLDEQLPGPALMPLESQLNLAVQALISDSDTFIRAGLSLVAANTKNRAWAVGQNASKARVQQFERVVSELAARIEHCGGPFLAGSKLTLADLIYWPFMERFVACAAQFSRYNASAGAQSVQRWIEAMQARDACIMAAPDKDAFLHAMHEHACLDWFDYQTCVAAELHPHLQEVVA